jgi:succinate dehydrogenase (ubiquinone) iron-sulfur subunit
MNLDGLHGLACIKTFDKDLTKTSTISPLGHMFVLRDLVVDMTNFYTQYKTIQPYLQRKDPKESHDKEFYQSKEDRKKIDGLYECVLCACCSTSCPLLLVAPRGLPGSCRPDAGLQVDHRQQRPEHRRTTQNA